MVNQSVIDSSVDLEQLKDIALSPLVEQCKIVQSSRFNTVCSVNGFRTFMKGIF